MLAAPGIGSPAAPGATAAMGIGAGAQAGAADPTAAAGQAAQGQWPSDYYSNYWGGEHSLRLRSQQDVSHTRTEGYYGQQAAGQQGAADAQHQGAA